MLDKLYSKNLKTKQNYLFIGAIIVLLLVGTLLSWSYLQPKKRLVKEAANTNTQRSESIILPNYFGALGTKFITTENNFIFLTQDYQFNGETPQISGRYFLSFPQKNIQPSVELKIKSPMTETEFPGVSVIRLNNRLFMFGYRILSNPDDYPVFSKNADAYMASISSEGEIGSWQKLNVGLPPGIPMDNGGYFLKTNGQDIFAVLVEDSLSFKIYKLNMQDTYPVSWHLMGELPAPMLGYVRGYDPSFQFLTNKILTISDNEINFYSYQNGEIGPQLKTAPIEFSDSSLGTSTTIQDVSPNIDYRNIYASADDQKILILLPTSNETKKVSLNLYKANLDDEKLVFKKLASADPGIDADNLQEVKYSQDSMNLFVLVHDLGEYNEVILRKLIIFPLH